MRVYTVANSEDVHPETCKLLKQTLSIYRYKMKDSTHIHVYCYTEIYMYIERCM